MQYFLGDSRPFLAMQEAQKTVSLARQIPSLSADGQEVKAGQPGREGMHHI